LPDLLAILNGLDEAYDYSTWHWQQDTSPDVICIGAVLVQHTQWSNVEHAMARLREQNALSLDAIALLREDRLAELLRPAGTPAVKANRLLALAHLARDHGGLGALLSLPAGELRSLLLDTPGIGPETADAILLYAAGQPVFMIDAYTIRIFRRLGLGPERNDYHTWQRWFEEHSTVGTNCSPLPRRGRGVGGEGALHLSRRLHALIVLHGKTTCRPRPKCGSCCLVDRCVTGRATLPAH
jgi:endonuclease-3 related protein